MAYQRDVTNWGKYPVVQSELTSLSYTADIQAYLKAQQELITRGNGRCYGDSSLNAHVFSALRLNKILAFDPVNGKITCQAGVLLSEVLEVIVPEGWFLPVTPGTKLVSVGGAIAADVHGKNHHRDGCFSAFLTELKLMLSDGTVLTCSKTDHADAFWATCGGMGLTGIILEATFSLKQITSSYMQLESIKASNLNEMMDLCEASEDWTYNVAWIDCGSTGKGQGRGILMRAEHAALESLPSGKQKRPLFIPPSGKIPIPGFFPGFVLNNFTIKIFNWGYYNKQFRKRKKGFVNYESYFYPLDILLHWNNLYGKNGFTQYQLVIPKAASREGLKRVLDKLKEHRKNSFLAVLKLFGEADPNALLSFPLEGYTLTLDLKMEPSLHPLLKELDAIVAEYKGRVYLAKDVRMGKELFAQSYPKKEAFEAIVKSLNSRALFQSLQSKRIGIHE